MRWNSPLQPLRTWSSMSLRRLENTNRATSRIAAPVGPNTASPNTVVRRRLQPRRSAAPTSAPSAAHAPIEVNAALPITRNPTADAAIVPVTTARSRWPRRDHCERDDGGREQRAAERHDLADDREGERDVGEHDGLGELARAEPPVGNRGGARRSHPDRFAYAGGRARREAPGRCRRSR